MRILRELFYIHLFKFLTCSFWGDEMIYRENLHKDDCTPTAFYNMFARYGIVKHFSTHQMRKGGWRKDTTRGAKKGTHVKYIDGMAATLGVKLERIAFPENQIYFLSALRCAFQEGKVVKLICVVKNPEESNNLQHVPQPANASVPLSSEPAIVSHSFLAIAEDRGYFEVINTAGMELEHGIPLIDGCDYSVAQTLPSGVLYKMCLPSSYYTYKLSKFLNRKDEKRRQAVIEYENWWKAELKYQEIKEQLTFLECHLKSSKKQ
jgi:hypothetical protein